MKVLLIYPYFLQERGKDYDVRPFPIGLYYIASTLIQAGHDVDMLNLHDFKGGLPDLRDLLESRKFDCVGLSLFNGNRFGALDCAKVVKEINPDAKVIFGGVGATFLWEFFLRHFSFVDYVILREGEETFTELLDLMASHGKGLGPEQLATIRGLAFRDHKGIPTRNEDRPFIEDLDTIPDPAVHFSFQHVLSSRGCPWNCTFCGSPKFWKRRVRFHSPAYFVGQLERLYRKGIDFFYVSDDTFTLKKDRVIEICKKIVEKRLDISWYAISRVNCVDYDILYWMRRAGCVQVSYGVESGSEAIRSFYNKGIKTQEIKRAFELTRRLGMIPRAYFIYGAPGDNKKTIDESIALMREIKPLSMVSYILDLYPGTRLYEDFKKKYKVSDDIWLQPVEDLMYFEIDPKMDQKDVLWMGRRLKRAYYAMLPSIIKTLEFEDKEELKLHFSEFLARLGLTFTHGDYANNDMIEDKEGIAEYLFKKALSYGPNHNAYLGLGILLQKKRRFDDSIHIMREALEFYPQSLDLNVCMGLNYMNKGDFKGALNYLLPFKGNKRIDGYIEICQEKIGANPWG